MDFLNILNLTGGELVGAYTAAYRACVPWALQCTLASPVYLTLARQAFAALGAYG